MLAKNHDTAVQWNMRHDTATGRAKMIVNVPADRVLADSDLVDRLIAAVFDRLGHTAVELRVWEQPEITIAAREVQGGLH